MIKIPTQKHYTDHEGNEFESITEMAKFWNISVSTLQRRLVTKKMPVKDALTKNTEEIKHNLRKCYDHLGNEFSSKSAMCKHYNIPKQVFFGRMGMGWSLKDSLTRPLNYMPGNSKSITDHIGQTFDSISDMCRHWNVTRVTYNARIKSGWSIEKALTTPMKTIKTKKQTCKDHLGNEYESLNEMCRKYNITHHTFSTRVNKLGWSVERALTQENVIYSLQCKDYNGNEFPTKKDMANYYNLPVTYIHKKEVSDSDLKRRIAKHWLSIKTIGDLTIEKEISFPYFLVTKNEHDYIYDLEEILNIYHNSPEFSPVPESKLVDKSLVILSCIGFPDYKVSYKGQIETWSYWDIIKYRHDTNFGLSQKEHTDPSTTHNNESI